MKVLMVASEAAPLAKTGGLADVVYALSKELVILGEEVSIVMPFYKNINYLDKVQIKHLITIEVNVGWRIQSAKIYKTFIDGITYYLIENDHYFDRAGFYGFGDDTERFAFFTLAIRNMIIALKLRPDVIHLHDYHAGLLPAVIKIQNARTKTLQKIKYVLTIHNPAFQGTFSPGELEDYYGISRKYFDDGTLRYYGEVNSIKAAIVYADKINTVSPTHALELLTPEGSKGLNSILELRRDDFSGILNGIDYEEFDPSKDSHIPHPFTLKTIQEKAKNKVALFKDFNLVGDENTPLYSLVSRLTWQKGIDLVLRAARAVLEKGANLLILGSGEYGYEQSFESLRYEFPSQMGLYIGYNNTLAHLTYAASDFFFMPSLFEPCGIGQMIAQRYGTLPLVRNTGGLKDTITGYNGKNPKEADGFTFDDYKEEAFINVALTTHAIYEDKALMKTLVSNAMKKNNDWAQAGLRYQALYLSIL